MTALTSTTTATPGPAYRIDGRPAAADAFYAVACDPQGSVVVEACAGAGKTWMLVSRVLRALLAGVQAQQILAITFTRKAAGEMRARLDEWLAAYADSACDHTTRVQALCQRGLSVAQAEAMAPALGGLHEHLLRAGRAVEVRTFHGWFSQLLAAAPLALLQQLGLPARYETIEDITALRDALLRRFHLAVQRDAALRADYLALVGRHRRNIVLEWLETAWRRGPELARADAAGNAEGAVPAAAARWPQLQGLGDPAELLLQPPLRESLNELARKLGAATKVTPQKAGLALVAVLQALDAGDVGRAFDLARKALFTDKGEPRKHLGDTSLQLAVQQALDDIGSMREQQQAHEDHDAMLRLARVLLAEYTALKQRRGLVDMADLERAAEAMLGDGELAGWVQERLDQRLRHVLIDEFQDTSPLQWQALHGWLSSYAGAGGGASGQRPLSVFIVGDPKQSIYRFRGAEPRIFGAARDFVVQGLEGRVLQCDHTRRNAPAVIAALNAVFEQARAQEAWGPYRAHTTSSIETGTVRRLPGVPRPEKPFVAVAEVWRDSLTQPRIEPELHRRAAEAAQAADAVAELLNGHGLLAGEVMVLARTRAVLGHVAQALAERGLPHVVAEPLALHESPEALDLAAVLDVLASPGHDIALARALKSPLFGASDADLLWLSRQAQGAVPWRVALLAADAFPSSALARAQGLLAAWVAAAAQLPPHDLLDRIVHQGDLVARLSAAVPPARRVAALRAVDALLAAALEQQGGRFTTVYSFVRELRAGRLRATGVAPSAAVQLLTVHGAKGLEARAVVIVDADPERRPAARAMLLVDWPLDLAAPRRVAFLRSESRVPPSLGELWAVEETAGQREELNGLYVAMTRAREWLVFSRTEPHARGPGQPWWARVEAHAEAWVAAEAPAPAAAGDTLVAVPTLPALAWLPIVVAPMVPTDAAAARLGQAVHRVLEWAGQPGRGLKVADLPAACAAAAAAFALPPGSAERVQAIAGRVLASPACARFFGGPALRWAGNEVPVADAGEPLRIDRLVALEGAEGRSTWWVLDYKLQVGPASLPGYRAQLQRYVAAVQALQPGDTVRGAFITGQGGLVEV